jgi:hypothetical protein
MKKHYNIKEFVDKRGEIGFRRWLPGFVNQQWMELREKVLTLAIIDEDIVKWGGEGGQWKIHS